jgi:hypothetical protein
MQLCSYEERMMIVVGWKKGKARVIRTDSMAALNVFVACMERFVYVGQGEKNE